MKDTPVQLLKWVENWILTQNYRSPFRLTLLVGDGSQRSFFRLNTAENPNQPKSFIVLYDVPWISSQDYAPHQDFLKKRGLPVPEFLAEDPKSGIVVMQDLGDELLQNRVLSQTNRKMDWLSKAVDLLADLHGKTYPVPKELPASNRFFDTEKYSQELQFTLEHLSEKLLSQPSATKAGELQSFCESIAKISPQVFCHRDYHTRNILMMEDSLYLIDFQDARLGSPHYDLSSLLWDAYIPLSPSDREILVHRYTTRIGHYPLGKNIDWENFGADLRRVAFQRVVKAAGSFASFYTRYQKTSHLPYLKPALQLAQELSQSSALESYRELFPLQKWIEAVQTLRVK